MKDKVEFLHSWYLFIISLLGLLFLLVSPYLSANLLLVIVLHYFYTRSGLGLQVLQKNIGYALFFSVLMFVLTLMWPGKQLQQAPFVDLAGWKVAEAALEKAWQIAGKLFLLVLTSMASARVINYTKVVLFLIVHKGLKVLWGYPLMIALNSILLFKEEYDRIKLNGQLRNLGLMGKVGVLFPLLVFAIRHSQRGSLALVTRGLNPSKSFYFSYVIYPHDRARLRCFLLFYAMLLLATLAFHFYFR